MENETQSQSKIQRFLTGFNNALPLVNILVTLVIVVGGYFIYTRDSQAAQTVRLAQVEQKTEALDSETKAIRTEIKSRAEVRDKQQEKNLTLQVFEASINPIKEEQRYQRQLLERILENQNR